MLISGNLHMKRSEVSIKTRSTPASLSFKGQGTKHATVKWSIAHILGILLMNSYNTDIFFSNYYNLQSVHFE